MPGRSIVLRVTDLYNLQCFLLTVLRKIGRIMTRYVFRFNHGLSSILMFWDHMRSGVIPFTVFVNVMRKTL